MSDEQAMLPYIHPPRHHSYYPAANPTLYMDSEDHYMRYLRKKRDQDYEDRFYRLHPHHAYWYDYHRRHHPPPETTRVSLPRLSHPSYYDEYTTVDPRLEAHYRYHRDHLDRDPYCTYCKPPLPKRLVPSMSYDEAGCHHCDREHHMKGMGDVMAFPWTPQTYRPKDERDRDDLRLRLEEEPPPLIVPYAQSAPPMEATKMGVKGHHPPYSAPPFPLLKPRMGLLDMEERRMAARRRPGYMSALAEEELDTEDPQHHISPMDSISNVGFQPFRSLLFHPNRLRPSHSAYSERFYRDKSHRAEATPPPIGHLPPRRRMEGQYMDIRNGRKYDYNVNYGKSGEVNSDRRVVR